MPASRPGTRGSGRRSTVSRSLINARIARGAAAASAASIAAALITGERAGISKEDNQAMRDSGLFHILSISGLHMVIMAGTVFWVVRALLALFPALALSYPIRKWAALRRARRRLVLSRCCRGRRCRRCAPGS